MRKNIVLYYVLMLFMVMGSFASMALNSYGVVLMSYVALAFALVFLFELVMLLPKEQEMKRAYKISLAIELIALSGICLGYFLQGIGADIPGSSMIKSILLMILFGANAYHLVRAWNYAQQTPLRVKGSIALYFLALLLLLGGNFVPPGSSWISVVLAFGCLIFFFIFGWWKGQVILNGEETSAWKKVIQFRNKSGIQLIFVTLASLYFLLSSFQLLPPLYHGSLPNGHTKVVQQWQQDKAKTNPAAFEEAYKKFLERK